ncbi:DUF4031 domain-containing protein [Nocardioides perillae]|uniref:Muramoyltetrapeptide carboxypeptidase n=1 Tax=Nocardioides perillae TaxID=1119534 RepID=A0A7Y9RT71_9ACTN|nr:DUF4031 domain-containing protein [Nocardioides perillae]NYG54874.1 muramoyltetrapeptide carboxypeptidase [Nocardioides perillae]
MLLIDPPGVHGPGGGLWSHLASDASYEELHDFAASLGIPRRGFDGDHYDVPAVLHDRVVAAGAVPVSSRELAARLVAAGLRRRRTGRPGRRAVGRVLLAPPPLRPGARVAVVAPSGPVDPARLAAGVALLRDWGLVVDEPVLPPPGEQPWLASTDAERAADLERAWLDEGVDAVWCARGGSGAHRVVDLLDWTALLEVRPPLLVGFSDTTALHEAVASRLGLVTVHGPVVAMLPDLDPAALAATRALVLEGRVDDLLGAPLLPGRAEGPLVGGNLTVLAAGAGTPTSRPARGCVAVLEDVAEPAYRLDRALTQLLRAGWFDGVHGVACGAFTDCGDPAVVRSLLRARLAPLGVPVVVDLPVGHQPANRPLPLGARAALDGDAGVLRVPDPLGPGAGRS